MRKKELGQQGEKLAAAFLQKRGYQILEHNFYLRGGELDLVAEKDKKIIFVEVKTRSSTKFGALVEQISARQKEKLIHSAEVYLNQKNWSDKDWQIDVVTVFTGAEPVEIEHFPNAIF